MHLERCLHDITTTFAPGIQLHISPPLVPYRETAAPGGDGAACASTATRHARLTVRAASLPPAAAAVLRAHAGVLCDAAQRGRSWLASRLPPPLAAAISELQAGLAGSGLGCAWAGARPVGVGSGDAAGTLLLCGCSAAEQLAAAAAAPAASGLAGAASSFVLASLISGFELGVARGPLCDEPVSETVFLVEDVGWAEEGAAGGADVAALPGQLISAMREACRAAFLDCGTRLLEPVYR